MIHCHVDLSDEKLTGSGAHLVEAKFVGLTAELLVRTFDKKITRKLDKRVNLKLLNLPPYSPFVKNLEFDGVTMLYNNYMEKLNIYTKLHQIQSQIKQLIRTEENKFQKYFFFNELQVLQLLKPLLEKYQLVILLSDDTSQPFLHDKDGKEHFINNVDLAKAKGSAETYAIKYLLSKFFLMPVKDEADPDYHQGGNSEEIKATSKIRNFSIIAHIDHGKSTLADRLLELTNLKGSNKSLERVLDSLLLEQEKVSRSLAACEGVILLVDATKGIQAQTLAYYEIAKNLNLKVLPVINKMDLPSAQLSMVKNQLVELLDCQASDICLISAKTGQNVDLLLEKIVTDIPPPLEK
ncbi:11278_t:CDS:2 [Entrophospora sp. SA101]|nr:11278_t:CDS:2 [Entrophospora sp. SA101]